MKPGGIAVVFLIICVVCYFAFPIAFVIPLMLVFGRVPPASIREAVRTVFKPIIILGDLYPPYRHYLTWQERLVMGR